MTGEGECMERLQKVIAASGITSRRKAEQYIVEGRVKVNGEVVDRLGAQVKKGDIIEVDGEQIIRENKVYYLMNKPKRTLCASSDDRGRQTVIDLMDCEERVFSVGRLDYDTSGALIITNDGDLAHRLLSPKKHVDKVYFARVKGLVTEEDIQSFTQGLDIGDEKPTLPAELVICSPGGISEICLTIREGRFHQVKRMFQAVGKEVIYLKRLRMGCITLDEALKPGEYRRLTEEEVKRLCSQERKL